jgi:hypothetical protein
MDKEKDRKRARERSRNVKATLPVGYLKLSNLLRPILGELGISRGNFPTSLGASRILQ